MKVFVVLAILVGLAAAQPTNSSLNEDVHQASNRTSKMLTFPEPLMKFIKPSYLEMWNKYGDRAMNWFQSLEATAIGFPLLTVGAVAVSISFLVSALVWVFAHFFGLQKGTFDKWLKPAAGFKVSPKPLRGSRVLSDEVDDMTNQVYEALQKFMEQKSQ